MARGAARALGSLFPLTWHMALTNDGGGDGDVDS